jgi:hypothetical protein
MLLGAFGLLGSGALKERTSGVLRVTAGYNASNL